MVAQTLELSVPALMTDRIIIHQFWLGKDIECKEDINDKVFSAAYYNILMTLPTLAEQRHAFFDRRNGEQMTYHQEKSGSKLIWVPDYDDWVSPEYRQSVLSNHGYGEWTSTFLQDDKKAVERPEKVVYRNGVWVLEGGKVTPVELPSEGWVLEYDKLTGFPNRTSQKRKDAEKIFGNDTSYFYHTNSGVRAVLRYFNIHDFGPFYVRANQEPNDVDSYIWGRACRRSAN